MKQPKGKGETAAMERFFKPVAFGLAVGVSVTILCFCMLSLLMSFRDIPHIFIEPLAITVASLGSFCGGYFAARALQEKGILIGAACGVLLFLLIALSGMTAGMVAYDLGILLKCGTIVLAAAVGGILGVNVKKKRK